jgi:hypothetical protein
MWSTTATPDPSGSYVNNLVAVSCAATNSCTDDWWASYKTLANNIMRSLNWNGENWVTGRTFVNKGSYSELTAIDCPSNTSCVVVGSKGDTPERTLVESWNGTSWNVTRSANRTNQSSLDAVSCVTSAFCVAVGHIGGSDSEFESPLVEVGQI